MRGRFLMRRNANRSVVPLKGAHDVEALTATVRGIQERAKEHLPNLLYRARYRSTVRAPELPANSELAEIESLRALLAEPAEVIVQDIVTMWLLDPNIVRGRENDRMKIVMALREDDDGED